MNAAHGTILGLAIVMGGWACSAQEATIPLAPVAQDGQLSARVTLPGAETAASSFSSSLPAVVVPAAPSPAGFIRVTSIRVIPSTSPRTLDSKYFLVNGLHLALALLDVEVTQRCIATNQYGEGNPLMPSSLGGQLSVNLALVGYGSFVSYKLKKHESRVWWLSPMVGVAAHSAGIGTGLSALSHQ
jgi:hypothetical protein